MKTCYQCKIELDEACFSKANNNKDRLNNYCRSCCSVRNREFREDNPTYQARVEEWRDRNKDKVKAYQRKYYQNNTDESKARNLKFRMDNPTYSHEYYLKNKIRIQTATEKWHEKIKIK